MVRHGLYKNLPPNTLYNSQIASVILTCSMVFKLSSLPGLVSEQLHSSTVWAYIFMTVVELFCCILTLYFMNGGGDGYLRAINSRAYKIVNFLAGIYLIIKGTLYFSYATIYLTYELFSGIIPSLVFLVFLIPIIYMGIKGVRTIARNTEIFILLILGIIIINLIFLKTDMDIKRNLPVFAMEPSELFSTAPRFGLWLGDLFPLAFVRNKKKKFPYIPIGVTVSAVLVNVIVAIGVAMYGNALPFVNNLLVRISGFNQLSFEIGRMEWTNLFCVLTMAIFALALIYWGSTECCERSLISGIPAKIAFPLSLALTVLIVPTPQIISDFARGPFGYVMFAFALALPILFVGIFLFERHRYPLLYKNILIEYKSPDDPCLEMQANSFSDGEIFKEKESADGMSVTPNQEGANG